MPENFNAQMPGASAALLHLIADTAPAMLAYFEVRTLRCLFANAPYARHFGFTPETVAGKTVRDIVGESVWHEIHPYVQQGLAGQAVRYTRTVLQPPLPPIHIETALLPHFEQGVQLGSVVQITDVSHHHRLAEQIRDNEERMRKFARATTEAIVLHRDGLIIDCNEALCRLIGYELDELMGRPILDFICPEYRLYAMQYMHSEREDCYDAAVQHKSGQRIPVEVEARTMPQQDEQYRIVLVRDITARQQTQQRMEFLAQHDALTRLPNRLRLNQLMLLALHTAQERSDRLAVICINLDHFKTINDSLGHHAGDLLLREIAMRLRSSMPASDLVAHIGADEFIVLLTGNPGTAQAERVAKHLRQVIEAPCTVEGTQIVVSPCMGIAMYPEDGSDCGELLRNADAAMQLAKDDGRNNLRFYTPLLEGRASRMLAKEQLLRQAVERNELVLHYQPQVRTDNGELAGFEALVRWRHPQHGLIHPEEFIGFAEARGLIAGIDHWVLHQACLQAKQWQDQGLPPVPMAVNLSAMEFRQRNMAEEVAKVLHSTGLQARYLHLELTESTLMHSSGPVAATLNALKALGVGLAIDDFGTGYSSLAYLRRHPIDKLKIDRSFVTDTPGSADDTAIVTAIVQMGRSLHLDIVAEGVETEAQLQLLRRLGCTQIQGFLVSPALDAEQARAWQIRHCHTDQRQ